MASTTPAHRPAAIADWRVVAPNWWYQVAHGGEVEVHLHSHSSMGWVIEQMCGTEHIAMNTYISDLDQAAVKAVELLQDLERSPLN